MKRGIMGISCVLGVAMAFCTASPMLEMIGGVSASMGIAHAQDSQVHVPTHQTRVARNSHLRRGSKQAAPTPSDSDDDSYETTSSRRLPDYFRNCEHPAPRLCNNNY